MNEPHLKSTVIRKGSLLKLGGISVAFLAFTSSGFADPFKVAVLASPTASAKILSDKTATSQSVGKIDPLEVFYAAPSEENWWEVKANENKSGFLQRSQIKIVEGKLSGEASSPLTPADITPTGKEPEDDAEMFYVFGLKYSRGIGVPQDFSMAVGYFMRAALGGHTGAKADLGRLYFIGGNGLKRDRKLAVRLLEEARTNGDTRAQLCYASCLLSLCDESDNMAERDRLFEKALSLLRPIIKQGGEDGARALDASNKVATARRDDRNHAVNGLLNALIGGGGGRSSQGQTECPRCHGAGREYGMNGNDIGPCATCGGSGYVDR